MIYVLRSLWLQNIVYIIEFKIVAEIAVRRLLARRDMIELGFTAAAKRLYLGG